MYGRGGLEWYSEQPTWEEVFDLTDSGFSLLAVRVFLVLKEKLSDLNSDRGGGVPFEGTNLVAGVSLEALAELTRASPQEVEAALGELDAPAWFGFSWLRVAGGEDPDHHRFHTYKLPRPTDGELAEQHCAVREYRKKEEERLCSAREERRRRTAEKAGRR